MRRVLALCCVALAGLFAGRADAESSSWLGLIAGGALSSETVMASDVASLFPENAEIRVRPMLGDAGSANLEALLNNQDVDMAFVGTDALAEAEAKDKTLADKLALVARLAPQEIHLLARADIGSLSDLAGREVNFGPPGTGSAATAARLFKALGITVKSLSLDEASALAQLRQGKISAAVIVGGKPSPLVSAISMNAGIHLLPIPFGAALEDAYLPTRLEAGDYPNLIQPGSGVPTVATGIALLTAKAKTDPASRERIARFVSLAFPRFAELKNEGRHPKWREVNLAAKLSRLARTPTAEAWLGDSAATPMKPVAASASAGAMPSLGGGMMSNEEKEALFKRFLDWQREKGR